MKQFGLIGVAGYIAPRHLKAIKETQNVLSCALDPYDGVGIMDSYFPNADFFTEFERFDRHVDKLRRKGCGLDFLSICSPNYLHDSHIRFGLRSGASVICEKPLVLNPWNIEALEAMQKETKANVYTILQLRLHPSIVALRKRVEETLQKEPNKVFDVELTYITSRGKWYFVSWKGDVSKSGGVATNIGVHFFDMLAWIFGEVRGSVVHCLNAQSASGILELKHARVRWFLSVDANALPKIALEQNKRTFRCISLNGESLEFSDGFTDLHTESYRDILKGGGFGLQEAKTSINIVHAIRNAEIIGLKGDYHPYLTQIKES
ncbi:Gfo/Idh/MocA family protein [Helicobacter turcicus]|uniref:Gfo/Idh/MocA family oxidoreductase n=1 Tax=Helicobacter turcicus TaxID=2867412 RepID=A0ABS7JQ21_9HELI|nr:Gfo/Idh/MocA family oxidoreductase [Helicobacter turcicus]MBX7491504.1 Gfo/Idh/MocA family oxidoreductase [Helicobacter turcicus]MBX7546360.1 Gfo/Idh/MocA family oxidoreductase [Helicobacter turcicus]